MSHNIQMQFNDFISDRGLKPSRQRQLILEAFFSADTRMSADDLFIMLRNKYPNIGRATVYRTLKLFAQSGIAKMLIIDGAPTQFEKHGFSEQVQQSQANKSQY